MVRILITTKYKNVSKSFRTESLRKKQQKYKTLVEKQHKGLWR